MEVFYDNIRMGIIKQAVDDYCHAVRRIVELCNTDKVMLRIAEQGLKRKEPKVYTVREAKEEIRCRINLEEAMLQDVEKFFFSDWYKSICTIDGEYIVKETREKAISELIRIIVYKLKEINEKNQNSKRAKEILEEYKALKLFLRSDYLERFTDRSCDSYIREIKRKTSDFFVTKSHLL